MPDAISLTTVNQEQVGGRHYKVAYEHWDWVVDCGLGYLDGTASKYLSRWKKKNGLEDLRKSAHYIKKLIQVFRASNNRYRGHTRGTPAPVDRMVMENCLRFFTANELGFMEQMACLILATWVNDNDLLRALTIVEDLITAATPKLDHPEGVPAKTVPASDSNKHADRAGP